MKMPIIVGDMRGIENTILLFEGVPLGEVLRNKCRVDGAVDDDMTDMDVLRAKFAGHIASASAFKPCLPPANAAKLARPRKLAEAPVNNMVPRPRLTIRLATSRPFKKPPIHASSQILKYRRAVSSRMLIGEFAPTL